MTLLQSHLGDSRYIKNSGIRPFWPSPLFKSQLVKEGEGFLLKGTPKTHRVFRPYQNSPFVFPTTIERGSYRKRFYGGKFLSSSNQSFSSGRGKSNLRGFRGRFQPHSRDEGVETPPPMTPFKPPSVHQ